MKKTIVTLLAALAVIAAPIAHAAIPVDPDKYTIVLAGGAAENHMRIWLTPDGVSYVIDSVVPLEVGGTVCKNAPGNPDELICQAPLVAGFEVNAGSGDDSVTVAGAVEVPVTMRGGPGRDTLTGGSGPDKLIGGAGNDRLAGKAGNDVIFGGPGRDVLFGGRGDDALWGGPGHDILHPGSGSDSLYQGPSASTTA